MSEFAKTPKAPYYAVIFSSRMKESDGYGLMAEKMVELGSAQKGFLGIESARDSEMGITVSYWDSLDAIKAWKDHAEHTVAQQLGYEKWYSGFALRISKVERDTFF
jgi:heme-degrading monooxygenase HmoA